MSAPVPRGCIALALALVLVSAPTARSFDLEDYRSFLNRTRGQSAQQFIAGHRPFGPYRSEVPPATAPPEYLGDVVARFGLTQDEQDLLRQHGFVVSERLSYPAWADAFDAVWQADLPVFVSSDAILHALHRSYVKLLASTELTWLLPSFDEALTAMWFEWGTLAAGYAGEPGLQAALDDVDVYVTVAWSLLSGQPMPSAGGNGAAVAEILALIEAEIPAQYPLFNDVPRTIDFSQFKPRGHYAEYEELSRYFQAMMWLGRTEFRLTEPPGLPATPDVRREIQGAFLVRELAQRTSALDRLAEMDRILRALVGSPDNVTLPELGAVAAAAGIENAADLVQTAPMQRFRAELATGAYTPQAINSQILLSDPMHSEDLDPPYAFLLLGQRFVLDSYIAWNVVYDRIEHEGRPIFRPMPAAFDVLYALGNDDALPLLQEELERYHYAPNLGALRYLIDAYEPEYWRSSLYTCWLQAIRTLAKSGRQANAPDFMRTVAWQQEKMNTQLASWAELRHDNLLYAKASYTGGVTCSFPRGYVEPVPELYRVLQQFAVDAREVFGSLPADPQHWQTHVKRFFDRMGVILGTLADIADKELAGTPLSPEECTFLGELLHPSSLCGNTEMGWYADLFFGFEDDPAKKPDLVVADIHTQPTDEYGSLVGRVLHVGTGRPELGVFVAASPGQPQTAYVGPVAAYNEHVTVGFQRLTDEEWQTLYDSARPLRPDWTHVYLADAEGRARPGGRRLAADDSTGTPPQAAPRPVRILVGQNVPNPFNPGTTIPFHLDGDRGAQVRLTIYDARGQLVRALLDEHFPPGAYDARWNGTDAAGRDVPSGIYFVRAEAEGTSATRKAILLR
jgi:hypothetical protein